MYGRDLIPLEAKILKTDGTVAKYVKEITGNFLESGYACFFNEAAMLGYLLNRQVEKVIENISKKLQSPLELYPPFRERNHRYSKHKRTGNEGATDFFCHHMIILFNASKSGFKKDHEILKCFKFVLMSFFRFL